ncbi:hypothetical protein VTH82DRAFT_6542 [Thermothelomyces myriococcoides]
MGFEADAYHKLTTLSVNVVQWETNQQWHKHLMDFVPEDIVRKYRVFDPADYSWTLFQAFLAYRFRGYSPETHVVAFAQHGFEDPDKKARAVLDQETLTDILYEVVEGAIAEQVAPGSELYFLIAPRENPKEIALSTSVPAAEEPTYDISNDEDLGIAESPEISATHNGCVWQTEIEIEEYDNDSCSGDESATFEASIARRAQLVDDEATDDRESSIYVTPPSDFSNDHAPENLPLKIPACTTASPKASKPTPSNKPSVNHTKKLSHAVVKGGEAPSTRGKAIAKAVERPAARDVPPANNRPSNGPPTPRASVARRGEVSKQPVAGKSTISKPKPSPAGNNNAQGRRGYSRQEKKVASVSSPGTAPPSADKPPTQPRQDKRIEQQQVEAELAKGEYRTASTADDDFGAVDACATVDTYLGSYNAGDSEEAWARCLDFFNLNLGEWKRREAIATAAAEGNGGERKRVPMKKLPGMTVGLFDYQLIGVYNLVRLLLVDVPGGLLCDEQGLGKTQEIYGVVALAHALRRSRAEVRMAWQKRAGDNKGGTKAKNNNNAANSASGTFQQQHHPPDAVGARSCPFDERYGIRCYCYSELTRALADKLPEGPNIIVTPSRGCASMVKDAKSKLDTKVFKIRGCYDGIDKEDGLSSTDVGSLRATIATSPGRGGTAGCYKYQIDPGQSNYIIFVSPEFVPRLNAQFSVEVKVGNSVNRVKKNTLLPGMVFMDEFHEYAIGTEDGGESRTTTWLRHLTGNCLDSSQLTPLAYFVSGTPLGHTPADLRPALSLLERKPWRDAAHQLNEATSSAFDDLVGTFDRLLACQAGGEIVARTDIVDYRRRLDRVLKHTMVRRLGTDRFQGRNLTDLGPLKVNIIDHQLPAALVDRMQALAEQTRQLAVTAAAGQGIPVSRLLRTKKGEAILLKLRLASTFPGIVAAASTAAVNFTFTSSETQRQLRAAKGDVTRTPYYTHVAVWSQGSPKLGTIRQTIATMLTDKTPIPGSPSTTKKYCIFSPTEAEAVLIQCYLLRLAKQAREEKSTNITTATKKSSLPSSPSAYPTSLFRGLKPVLLHSGMTAAERQQALEGFLAEGNAAPNVLVAPLALAGTGLNLQRARYGTVTGPAWTKREAQQAYYRIHRVGQRMRTTRLALLTARWNPAERFILAGYDGGAASTAEEGRKKEGKEGDDKEEEEIWQVGNRFCCLGEGGGDGVHQSNNNRRLVERHQVMA